MYLPVQKLLAILIVLLAITYAHSTVRLATTTFYSGDDYYVHTWNEVYHYNPNYFTFIDSLVLFEGGNSGDRINDIWYCQTSFSDVGTGTILQHDYYNSQQVLQRRTITETDSWGRKVCEQLNTGDGNPASKIYRFYPPDNINRPDSVMQYVTPTTYLRWVKYAYSYDSEGRKDITTVYTSSDSITWTNQGWIANTYEGLLPFPIDTEQKLFTNFNSSLSNSLSMILDPVSKLSSYTTYPSTYPYNQYPPHTYPVNYYYGTPVDSLYYIKVFSGDEFSLGFHPNGMIGHVRSLQSNEQGYSVWGTKYWWQDAVVDVDDETMIAVPKVSAYPNPFKQSVLIRSTESDLSDIEIYNIKGQLVRSLPCKGAKYTEWDGLDENRRNTGSGIYLLKVKLTDRFRYFRVMKL